MGHNPPGETVQLIWWLSIHQYVYVIGDGMMRVEVVLTCTGCVLRMAD